MSMLRTMPVLQVRDVVASAGFYERLGFFHHGFWGDPPCFCIVQSDGISIALDGGDTPVPTNHGWAVYVYVEDVSALHAEFSALGLPEMTEIRRGNPYGCDDFDVIDPDGHHIAFGQDMEPGASPGLVAARHNEKEDAT
ncbi:hypothetical protein M3P21_09505 [Ruegeria sp. 2012CJ41-6]|uniref:VOC domain-containing protein n=1 Tax=Ruegeria spongiae TaxID=2942209 RepID=A0ABT0Q1T3_9RHOB|nr:glyoxalase superfamily protein [Ruegeria spongiae]MCL6283762.1 hypothetical protein [Ruegeria spongiae]